MRRALVLLIIGAFAALPNAVSAGSNFDFSFTTPSGGTVVHEGIGVFSLDMVGLDGLPNTGTLPVGATPFSIASLELEVTGLSHPTPMNLTIFLIDPHGDNVFVMDGQGGSSPIAGVDLTFNDNAAGPLPVGTQISTGTFLPTLNTFSQFGGSGINAWELLIINDVRNNQPGGGDATFDSFTLRGTVPEPVTLSLLALGALATFRRKRR